MPEKLQFSSIVERSVAILGRNLTGAALLAVLLAGLPGAFLSAQLPVPGEMPPNVPAFFLGVALVPAAQNLLVGMMLYPVFRHLLGLPAAGIGLWFSYGAHLAMQAVLVALALGLILSIGLFMFVLPGVIFMLVFFVAMPAAVVERLPVGDALRRSVQLTEGHRWTILGYLVILWIANLLLTFFAGTIFSIIGLAEVAVVIVSSLVSAFAAIAVTVIYHDLRRMKEGATAEDMVRVLMQDAGR